LKIHSIGIIGYGRFGRLLAAIFKHHLPDAKVLIYSGSNRRVSKTLAEVCAAQIVIPAVPISAFKELLIKIKPLLGSETTVMDICSVKVLPVKWMHETLDKKTRVIASHPVFGPDSTRNGKELKGMNLMICNISADKELYGAVKNFWKNLGVNVLEMTPEDHDRYSAYTINYNHLIGRIGQLVGIRPTPIDTKGFKVIYDALQYVINDSWELFYDMQNFNPYSKKMRKEVMQALTELEKRLDSA
jgi:prephenate dehydrogenase